MNNKRINKLIKNLRKQQRITKRKLKNIKQNKDFKSDITELLLDLSYARAKVIELKLNQLQYKRKEEKIMKRFLFDLYLFILIVFITTCGFGGGCIYYIAFCWLCGFEQVSPVWCIITCLAPIPLCWWLAPKISDKYF